MIDSLEGETDINGDRVCMHHYDPYGTPFEIDVFLDVSAAESQRLRSQRGVSFPGLGIILDRLGR
jgi:hypothetical protein